MRNVHFLNMTVFTCKTLDFQYKYPSTKLNDDEEIQDTKLGNHIQNINGELLCM